MERSEFINKYINPGKYSWREIDGKIVINSSWDIFLNGCDSIPKGVIFDNGGDLTFRGLQKVEDGTEFTNKGNVFFSSHTKSIGKNVIFKNLGQVTFLGDLIEEDVVFENFGNLQISNYLMFFPVRAKFNNKGEVRGKWVSQINIPGISNKDLLRCMSKQLYQK